MEGARLAVDDDLEEIVALAQVARAEVADSKGGESYLGREARQEPIEESLASAVVSDDEFVVVGTIDDVAVGFAYARTDVLPDGDLIAEAGEIFVLEGARGVGVGEVMLESMMDWARDRGCLRLEGVVLPGNRHGKNFFERAAMVTRLLRVSTPLDQA